ncbi:MAG: DUF5658 family protein [Myxococcota bacterium]|nr:DUF5658 family protein [Myxococcota bacterium]
MSTDPSNDPPKDPKRDDEPQLRLVAVEPRPEGEEASPYVSGGVDRRRSEDRRQAPTRGWDSLLGFHRRKRGRRTGERDNIYVDSYSRQDVALTLGVLVLNILDAFFTLRWLEMGGGEGNPLMDMLIKSSDMLFLLQKCVVVGLWLVVLIVHKNFRVARMGLWGALALYLGILFYHFALQAGGPPPTVPPIDYETFRR